MVCLQNAVFISLIVVAVLIAVEITRWVLVSKRPKCKPCHSPANDFGAVDSSSTQPTPVSSSPLSSVSSFPSNPNLTALPSLPIPVVPPFNQITHGVPDEWTYTGYASPKSGTKPGKAVRYPLYARQNLYQKNGYDYYVIDDSRNRVRINIDLPRGVYQLWSGDEIEIDGETGKWVVTIDVPPDTAWQRGFPFFPRF